ncbi:MAG: hypothetical protein GVY19_04465 [Bacteroidetes bacterium]|jgi:tetratricopeptide (TPR) repeat protein|nr:hypothetical protein [Bacteroidota bacterium]
MIHGKKPIAGWLFRKVKMIVSIDQYLRNRLTKRHLNELFTDLQQNQEMFDEFLIRNRMEQALKKGDLQGVIRNYDDYIKLIQQKTGYDYTLTDEPTNELHAAAIDELENVRDKLSLIKEKTGHDNLINIIAPHSGSSCLPAKEPEKSTSFPSPNMRSVKKFMLAASILFVLGLTVSKVFINNHYSTDQLFDQYYTKYEIIETKNANMFSHIESHYQSGAYIKALISTETLKPQTYDQATKKLFYMGILSMETSRFDEAIGYFDEVQRRESYLYENKAVWYQGLSYLKLGRKEEAYRCFTRLKEREIFNKTEAARIIRKMR